jgi:phosphate transport system substrate-binding protein
MSECYLSLRTGRRYGKHGNPKIINWRDVGGSAGLIKPYIRNTNSGSQELMETLVMKDLEMKEWPQEPTMVLGSMSMVFTTVMDDINSICYTLYYYNEQMMKENIAKTIAVDGIAPNKKSIKERRYSYIAELYVVIRSDLDKSSMAYKLYELLQTEDAKHLISESGYIPL